MPLVQTLSGKPTLSEVAVSLSDPRTGLGAVTARDVFDACCARRIVVCERRIDGAKLAEVYFELRARQDA